jgi:hypothetical protein
MNGICQCSNPTVTVPATCGSPECLGVPHVAVPLVDSVLPCAQALIIDMHDRISLSTDYDASIAIFEVESHSDNLTNVSFLSNATNTSIQLSVTSNYQGYPATDYTFGKVTYKVIQGLLSGKATVTIPFKSNCTTVSVPDGQYCDPCTGTLANKITNIVIGTPPIGATTTNIQIG